MSLTDKKIEEKYGDLIAVDNSNSGIAGGTQRTLEDGLGNESCLQIGTTSSTINLGASGSFVVKDNSGNAKLTINNTSTTLATAPINTNQLIFNIDASGSVTSETHYMMVSGDASTTESLVSLGTSTDPSTTVSTVGTMINNMHYLHSAINIDSAHFFASTGSNTNCTINFHLMSYAFNFANSDTATNGDLSDGVVVVDHSPSIRFTQSDRINSVAGTVQSASVAAGRVLVASIENATNTDSISGKVVVNYHYI